MLTWYDTSNNGKYAKQCNKAFPLGQDIMDFVEYKIKKSSLDQLTLLQFIYLLTLFNVDDKALVAMH